MSLLEKKSTPDSSLAELIDAVIVDDPHKVEQLLIYGLNPNACEDVARVSPLHFAAQYNALQSALLLIKAGADVDAETADGLTPLEIAKVNANDDMIVVLDHADVIKH